MAPVLPLFDRRAIVPSHVIQRNRTLTCLSAQDAVHYQQVTSELGVTSNVPWCTSYCKRLVTIVQRTSGKFQRSQMSHQKLPKLQHQPTPSPQLKTPHSSNPTFAPPGPLNVLGIKEIQRPVHHHSTTLPRNAYPFQRATKPPSFLHALAPRKLERHVLRALKKAFVQLLGRTRLRDRVSDGAVLCRRGQRRRRPEDHEARTAVKGWARLITGRDDVVRLVVTTFHRGRLAGRGLDWRRVPCDG